MTQVTEDKNAKPTEIRQGPLWEIFLTDLFAKPMKT